ncbi:UNVERIFIED_CONTAM: hypothetical protein PYX00_008887 [Menopon gallinae]|uniref:ABC transporter domain-containing protein n=1 Tax=Menopon gallinae TaxID=328185 RepID=A0AAW2H935_9NEOP
MDEESELTPSGISFLKKQSVDVTFTGITFEVRTFKPWRRPFIVSKEILHGVSGELPSGQLTAIMGPSGAGKSTLLNILAGYTVKGVEGTVRVNKKERSKNDVNDFKRLSCYIQQDEHLRGELTVQEAMKIAAELKLGSGYSAKEKQMQIKELLEMLGLYHCLKTRTARLSGGQKKRLSIAFELLTNPPVIFLDEPTTGLDSSSCSQCISILKMLAEQGRTVVCTIHQPSALIFEMFDRVYGLAAGHCIYEGSTKNLVPFLSERGFKCPVYHNPADFLLEVASGEYGPAIGQLAGYYRQFRMVEDEKKDASQQEAKLNFLGIGEKVRSTAMTDGNCNLRLETKGSGVSLSFELGNLWPKTFITQFYYLYSRNILIFQKKYKYRLTTFFSHILPAVLIGLTFLNTGNDASMVRANICFVFGVLIFLIYLGKMSVTLTIPNELHVLRAEHFNRWYSLLPYYLSMIIIEIPMQTINCFIGVTIVYYLSNQPLELFRYSYFILFCTAIALAAQAIGFFLGATVPVKIAAFVGPVSAATCSVFGFTVRFCDLSLVFKWMSLFSYFRSAFHGIMTVLYGYDRGLLECNDLYCHFRTPKKILDEMDMANINIYANLIYISSVCVVMHFLTFITLYMKLNNR